MQESPEFSSIDDEPAPELEGVNLIYKIEGKPSEVDALELSRVLEAFGNILAETYKIMHGNEGEMVVKVKPFEPGSFIMDLDMHIRQNAGYIFILSNLQLMEHVKDALEALGLIKKIGEKTASLFDLLRQLKNGRPKEIKQNGPDGYEFEAIDGSVIAVGSTVKALYSSPVINNYTFNIAAPAQHRDVQGILTYLRNAQAETAVKIDKQDVEALRAYSAPALEGDVEVLEDITTKVLQPKSGNYGQTRGTWSFTVAGAKGTIKAKISDADFLRKYASGSIRFYQGDRLKVRLKEKQIVEGDRTKMEYEIVEVLEYRTSGGEFT